MSSARLLTLADRFTRSFPENFPTWRKVGREAEFPVVDSAGEAADVPAILETMAAADPSLRVSREGALITGLHGEHAEYALEVGRGTIEVITGPADDLVQLEERHNEALAPAIKAAREHGARLLGLGIQPKTAASLELMSPKAHYQALLESIGPGWLSFAVTASDQVHVDISRYEIWPLTNLGNMLAGVTVALTANSSVHPGAEGPVASARELIMGTIGADAFRHGMAGGPVRDSLDFVGKLAPQPFLLAWEEDRKVANFNSFSEWIGQHQDVSPDELWRQYLLHEHYFWHSARPRANHATLELRSACQQPHKDSMAAAALGLGLVLAGPDLAMYVDEELGDRPWEILRSWHHDVALHGLATPDPEPGFLSGLLSLMESAVARRKRGEEKYLAPLRERLEARTNPAQEALATVEKRGLDELINRRALS